MTTEKYPRIVQYVTETVWAIRPRELGVIWSMLKYRAQGGKLDQADIEERIGGGRKPEMQQSQGSVAVIPLWGVLVPHAGMMVDQSTPGTGIDQWLQMFKAAVDDPNVASILIDVNSPGGSVSGITEAAAEIRAARSVKPVVAVVNSLAASAGYALASQADTLIVPPSGMVGSIGTYMIHEDISRQLEEEGVVITVIESPADGFKTEASPFKPLSDAAKAHMQEQADYFQGLFEQDVADGRRVDVSAVRAKFGKGRVYTARAALAVGMVDAIGTIDETLQRMVEGKPAAGTKQLTVAPAIELAAAAFVPTVTQTGFVYDLAGSPASEALTEMLVRSGFTPDSASKAATTGNLTTLEHTGMFSVQLHDPDPSPAASAATATPTNAASSRTHEGGSTMPDNSDGRPQTREDHAANMARYKAEMDVLTGAAPGRAFDDTEQARFDDLEADFLNARKIIANMDDRERRLQQLVVAANPGTVQSGDGARSGATFYTNADSKIPHDLFDDTAYRSLAGTDPAKLVQLWQDGAKKINETTPYATKFVSETREFIERMISQDHAKRVHDAFSSRFRITANPKYDQAFGNLVMGRLQPGDHALIEQAVTNTGLSGETPVPVTIDPTVLYTGDGARLAIRELSQVVSITGSKWRGLASDGTDMAYAAETAVFEPDTPTFDAPDVTVVRAQGEIQFSLEIDMDWPSLRDELRRMYSAAKFRLEADKFLNGNGTNEPTGLIFALDDDGTSIVDTADANVLALADVIEVSDELPSSFDYNAYWLAHKSFYSNVAALAAAEGRIDVWVPLSGGFNQQSGMTGHALLNSPATTASEVSKLFTTGGEEVAVIGDFNQGFVIVDRVGLNVEIDMHPRDSNGKWTGARAMLCYFRNNTALRTPNAFRLLRIKHT